MTLSTDGIKMESTPNMLSMNLPFEGSLMTMATRITTQSLLNMNILIHKVLNNTQMKTTSTQAQRSRIVTWFMFNTRKSL